MSALRPLQDLVGRGMQPAKRLVWLGLGFEPKKRCSIAIDPDHLPTEAESTAVAGLDVILLIHGYTTSYKPVRKLCAQLYAARPRRLQVIDLDYRRVAYLVLGGR
jgi:hypothetical protein